MARSLITWSDEYRIGGDELDFDHREFFVHLNVLHEELMNHDAKEKIEECLDEMYTRLGAHFAFEESYMLDTKNPDYSQHKKEHDEFLGDMAYFINEFMYSPGLSYGGELEDLLGSWIIEHITTSDRDMIMPLKTT